MNTASPSSTTHFSSPISPPSLTPNDDSITLLQLKKFVAQMHATNKDPPKLKLTAATSYPHRPFPILDAINEFFSYHSHFEGLTEECINQTMLQQAIENIECSNVDDRSKGLHVIASWCLSSATANPSLSFQDKERKIIENCSVLKYHFEYFLQLLRMNIRTANKSSSIIQEFHLLCFVIHIIAVSVNPVASVDNLTFLLNSIVELYKLSHPHISLKQYLLVCQSTFLSSFSMSSSLPSWPGQRMEDKKHIKYSIDDYLAFQENIALKYPYFFPSKDGSSKLHQQSLQFLDICSKEALNAYKQRLHTSKGAVQYNEFFKQFENGRKLDLPCLLEKTNPHINELCEKLLPNQTQICIHLLKILLGCYPALLSKAHKAITLGLPPLPSGPNVTLRSSVQSSCSCNRDREIMAQSVTFIILALLKLYRSNYIMQFESMCQSLDDANGLLLFFKIISSQGTAPLTSKNEIFALNYFNSSEAKGNRDPSEEIFADMKNSKDPSFPPYQNQRAISTYINILRCVQMMTKGKSWRLFKIVSYKGPIALTKLLGKIEEPRLTMYALKILKSLTPYMQKKWRQDNMNILSQIYMHTRPDVECQLFMTPRGFDGTSAQTMDKTFKTIIRFFERNYM